MDGLKFVIPMSCKTEKVIIKGKVTLFGTEEDKTVEKPCVGCENNIAKNHNGIYVNIMDWKESKVTRFVDIIS